MIEAKLLTMSGYAPVLRRERNGYRGVRHYWVNTTDEFVALTANGLPSINTPWNDTNLASLLCTGLEIEYIGGIDDVAPNEGGITYVRADYETPALYGTLPPPQPGEKYTRIIAQQSTYTVRLAPNAEEGDPKVGGGEGATATMGNIAIEVVTFPEPGDVDFQRLCEYASEQYINAPTNEPNGLLELPPPLRIPRPDIYGINTDPIPPASRRFAPGTLKYASFSYDDDTGILRVVHTLEFRYPKPPVDGETFGSVSNPIPESGHHARWRYEDANGQATGPVNLTLLYDAKDFTGLW